MTYYRNLPLHAYGTGQMDPHVFGSEDSRRMDAGVGKLELGPTANPVSLAKYLWVWLSLCSILWCKALRMGPAPIGVRAPTSRQELG